MNADESHQDPWFEAYAPVSSKLQSALGLFGNERHFNIAFALAQELGLRTEQASLSTWKLIYEMVVPLANAVEEGSRILDDRALQITATTLKTADVQCLSRAMVELGWRDARINTSVGDLVVELRNECGKRLVNHVQRVLLRWDHKGVFKAA